MTMMRTLAVVAMLATPAAADEAALERIDGWIDEVNADREYLARLYDYRPAPDTLDAAFVAGGIGWARRYKDAWGGWIFLDWDRARPFHRRNAARLGEWRQAVARGSVEAGPVLAALSAGMEAHRTVHEALTVWFRDDVKNAVERAYWLDRRAEAAAPRCCDERYIAFGRLADRAFEDSISGDYRAIGNLVVFPPVPREGEPAYTRRELRAGAMSRLGQRIADAADRPGRAVAIAIDAALVLEALPVEGDAPAAPALLDLLATLTGFDRERVAATLAEAAAREGAERTAVLEAAREGLLERVGVTAPLAVASILAGRAAGNEADERDPLAALADDARVLARLADDLTDPTGPSSAALRAASGLTAAAEIVSIAGGERPDAARITATLTHTATALSRGTPVPSAFAAPMGAVGAHVDNVAGAFGDATDAMDAVADAMRGDRAALERAEAAARRLDERLKSGNLLASMAEGAATAIVENVPFGSEILALFRG